MSKFILACVAMCIVELGLGAYSVIITRYAKKAKTDPLIFCLYRDGLCFPFLFFLAYIFGRKMTMPNRRELLHLMLIGSIGMFANQLCFILGVYYTSVDTTALFRPLAPLCAMFLAIIFKLESLPKLKTFLGVIKIVGIIFALFGAITVAYSRKYKNKKSHDPTTNFPIVGYIALLGNALCTGLYIVLQKKLIFQNPNSTLRNQPITVTAWSYFFGFVCMAITSVFYVEDSGKLFSINSKSLYPLLYAVLITSSFCYILQSWSNMYLKSTLIAAFWPLQVFYSVTLAYFVLGETLSLQEIFGGTLMISGLVFVVWSNYKEERRHEEIITKV